jgi:predicted transposase YdaD
MLRVNLEESKVYQEAKAEGREEGRQEGQQELKLELVARMRRRVGEAFSKSSGLSVTSRGMTTEDIAQILDLTVEQVIQA